MKQMKRILSLLVTSAMLMSLLSVAALAETEEVVDAAVGETQQLDPAGTPGAEETAPAAETTAPAGPTDAPAAETGAPAGPTDAPAAETKAPAEEEAPLAEIRLAEDPAGELDPEVQAVIDDLKALRTPEDILENGYSDMYGDRTKIAAAKAAYEALDEDQQAQVPQDLAEKVYADEAMIAASRIKSRLPDPERVALDDYRLIYNARQDVERLSDWQKDLIGQDLLDKLAAVEEAFWALYYESSFASIQGQEGVTYDTVLDAVAEARDGDTILVQGKVIWGGNGGVWPEGALTIRSAGDTAWIITNGDPQTGGGYREVDKRSTDLGCDVTFTDVGLSFGANMNYIFANGHKLTVGEDVEFQNIISEGNPANGTMVTVFGGSRTETVPSAELVLLGGRYSQIYGGGAAQDVEGSVSVELGPQAYGDFGTHTSGGRSSVGGIIGGGYYGDVGGDIHVLVRSGASVVGVTGGCRVGDVGGSTLVEIQDGAEVTGYSALTAGVIGGSQAGGVDGDTVVRVAPGGRIVGAVAGSVYDATSISMDDSTDFPKDGKSPSAAATYVGGSTYLTLDRDSRSDVYGGSYNGTVAGDTHVELNGTAPNVFGGSYCSTDLGVPGVGGSTYVTVGPDGGVVRRLDDEGRLWDGKVVGGGQYYASVAKDTHIVLNGRVGSEELGALVLGTGFTPSSRRLPDVGGTAYITVNAAPYPCTREGLVWRGFGDYRGLDSVNGIYGGGFNYDGGRESTQITINTDIGAVPVYGGGLLSNATGKAAILFGENGGADKVYGCGYNADLEAGQMEASEIVLTANARVDTIYGYGLNDYDGGDGLRNVSGQADVRFQGHTGAVRQIVNADAVTVTGGSDVTIDDEGRDDAQLVNVSDLSIGQESRLTLAASAHILGGYSGDTAEGRGLLVLPAGKRLAVDGTVAGLTGISIVDTELVQPAEAQVYVTSGAGSTTESGDYAWVDRRTGLAMEWKANDDATTQWWLVKYDEPTEPEKPVEPDTPSGGGDDSYDYYRVTVNYLDQDGAALAKTYVSARIREDRQYDVREQARLSIEGYTLDRWEGDALTGTMDGNKTVDVYYVEKGGETQPGGGSPEPTQPGGEVDITDGQVPQGGLPEDGEPPLSLPAPEPGESGGEVIIVDDRPPLGDLPQTGTLAAPADPTSTLAALALAASLLAAGLAVGVGRRKDEEA